MESAVLAVIGSSNVDFIMKMDHLPAVGETVTDAEFMQTFGGKGANQAVGAARAGGKVLFVNAVGDDPYAVRMVGNFASDGIDVSSIFHETGISSGTALVMIGESGANYLSVSPGANYRLTPDRIDALRERIRDAGMILLQYEIPADTNARILEIADEEEIPVMWNFAPARKIDRALFSYPQILVVNENEAAFLLGRDERELSADEMIRQLQALGPRTVVITQGARGVTAGDGEAVYEIPAYSVEAVDTTAAGDIFCGSLAVALVEGKGLDEALRFASGASALSVTKMGAQPSAPKREEIEAFLQAQR
jgi:ribokinase